MQAESTAVSLQLSSFFGLLAKDKLLIHTER